MAVQSAAIWPEFRIVHLHQNHEAGGFHSETASQNDPVPGRHANPALVRRVRHLASAMKLLVSLGFLVNFNKSVLSQMGKLEFLGFLIDPSHQKNYEISYTTVAK